MKKVMIVALLMLNSILSITFPVSAYNSENEFNIPREGEKAGDIIAPEINASSLSVSQKSVGIGDIVKVSLAVEDNQSGVEQVEVYYQMPQTKRNEWVILRYNKTSQLYEGYINITEDTEDGVWKIDCILARDKVGNSQYLHNIKVNSYNGTVDLSHGDFEVKGTSPDVTAPEINASSLGVSQKFVGIGDIVKVSLAVEDNQSGVEQVEVYYQMPQTKRNEWVILHYNKTSQLYEGYINITEDTEDGVWKIDCILARDKVGNSQYLHNIKVNSYNGTVDLSHGDFEVKGTSPDVMAPEINASSLSVSQKSVGIGDIVKVSLAVEDNQSGVEQVEVYYQMPQTKRNEWVILRYNKTSQLYEGYINITEDTEDGVWKIDCILARDKVGNSQYLHNIKVNSYNGTVDLSHGNFEVITDLSQRPFPDVEVGKWYTTHIQDFISLGYINGYSDGMFKPQNPMTRAEFVKIVNKAFGLAEKYTPVTDLPFTDLDSQWKKDELKLALAAGYITPATEFRHNDPINRQEAAKIVGYLLGDKLTNDSDWEFTDFEEIATWAQDYVAGLVEAGVLSKNETFRPKDPITRAEAVKMLNIAR